MPAQSEARQRAREILVELPGILSYGQWLSLEEWLYRLLHKWEVHDFQEGLKHGNE